MCAEGRPDDTYGNARIFAGRVSDAYLVRGDIGQPGYTIVIWRGGHIADLTELSDSDATTYLREVLKVARALGAHYQPAKMNLEMLGNAVPHLHTHLVPRYVTDDSPGQPAKGLMQPDPHRKPIADDVFHRRCSSTSCRAQPYAGAKRLEVPLVSPARVRIASVARRRLRLIPPQGDVDRVSRASILCMNDRVDFFCGRPEHQGAEPNDALTMHDDRWAYCPAAASAPHNWQSTGGMSLDDVKQFVLGHPIRLVRTPGTRSD